MYFFTPLTVIQPVYESFVVGHSPSNDTFYVPGSLFGEKHKRNNTTSMSSDNQHWSQKNAPLKLTNGQTNKKVLHKTHHGADDFFQFEVQSKTSAEKRTYIRKIDKK